APCVFTLSPTSQSMTPSGGSTTTAVSAAARCSWTAVSTAPWISVAAGSSGAGNGTVTMTVDANAAGSRTGTVAIADQTFTIAQDAAPCSFAISPASQSIAADGGVVTTTITTAGYCSWTAAANDPWLTIASGASGTGGATVSVAVAANSSAARSGTAAIAGQTFTVA